MAAPSSSGTTAKLAAWLAAHMASTRQSVPEVAKDLGVSAGTVRNWLARSNRRPLPGLNEFDHLDTPVKLGAWLRVRIADSGCSVRQIAETTEGVSMSTIYNWLKGEHLPPPPVGDQPDRFDLLLRNPRLALELRQRVQLDEIRRRLTDTSLEAAEPVTEWPARGLPAHNRAFAGRASELKRLNRLLRDYGVGTEVVLSVLTGTGGVGKTALAVHWARTKDVRTTFTDGCLYLNLNGYAETPPMAPETAIGKLLRQLGVDSGAIPADPDALAAFYQQTLAGRKLLVILDNAYAEPQVRQLLPADPTCSVVITSRNRLHGLAATEPGITHLELDMLAPAQASSLLQDLLGRLATASETDVLALAETCGFLPLALHIAAANYLTHHHPHRISLGEYTKLLSENRLSLLTMGPTDPATAVTATIDRSYQHLTAPAQRVYRLLGLHPGPDCSAAAAAGLAGLSLAQVRTLLSELTQANLLSASGRDRYEFHDLVRDHAAELARSSDSERERHAATGRMLDHYLHSAYAAAKSLDSARRPLTVAPPSPEVVSEEFETSDQAMAWFTAEHSVLLAAVDSAAATGFDTHTWQLAWSVGHYLDWTGHHHDWALVGITAVNAADRLGDSAPRARTRCFLAHALIDLGRAGEARSLLEEAIDLCQDAGLQTGRADAHHSLVFALSREGHDTEALEHARTAHDLYRTAGARTEEGHALYTIGWLHAQRGEFTAALTYSRRALEVHRETGDRRGRAEAWECLGYIHRQLDRRTEAIGCYREARMEFQSTGSRFHEARVLRHLGDVHQADGDRDASRNAWEQALQILTDLDHADAIALRALLTELRRELRLPDRSRRADTCGKARAFDARALPGVPVSRLGGRRGLRRRIGLQLLLRGVVAVVRSPTAMTILGADWSGPGASGVRPAPFRRCGVTSRRGRRTAVNKISAEPGVRSPIMRGSRSGCSSRLSRSVRNGFQSIPTIAVR